MAASDDGPALYRIGRHPDPMAGPPGDSKSAGNRFDDPAGRFWTLYGAEARLTCFLETLARFRHPIELLVRLQELPDGEFGDDTPDDAGVVPDDWHLKRRLASFRVAPNQRWLDVRTLAVREMLRAELAQTLRLLGYADFDLSDILNRDRRLSQEIARWAIERKYSGIIYTSRLEGEGT